MYRKGKAFLSVALLIIFSIQLLLSIEIATSQTVGIYHPTGYNLLAETAYVSGVLTDLQSDTSVYMTFRSYFSGTDTLGFVDNDTSDVDSSADKGTHSNFSAQQAGPDGQYEVLTEQNIGGVRTLIIRPNAAGSKSDWNPVGSTSNWECVDETTPDEDTTFVNTTTKSKKDFYNLQDHTTETGSISNVRLYVRAKGNAGAELELRLTVDLIEYQGQEHTLTTSYANYYDDWATNPAGGNWTWSDIDALEAGFMSSTSAAVEHGVTQLYVEVAYTGDSYELDLEVQWTNVDYDEANEYLCIYAGNMETENLRVDYWAGSSWSNLFTDLTANNWNNVSVSLTSTAFTIRFKDGTETGDTVQDFWNIDVTLLHVWTDQYTSEVEFTGSSNTYTWTQLIWTVDSAWTTGSVGVTLQLYNYSLGDYPTSGNGHMSYTSSVTENTVETKSQTITTNSGNFRDTSGNWKMKIKGVKSTTSQFDFKADLVKYGATFVAPPDVAVLNVTGFPTSVYPGEIVEVNVTVKNEGGTMETFNVTLYYDNTKIGKQLVSSLAPSANTTLTFDWNTTGVSSDTYTIEAVADIVPGETDTADNTYVDGTVIINTKTSSPSFDWFTPILYALPVVFGLLVLLTVKLKREKRTDTFSESFGMTHQQMVGKKMLLEIDPTSHYHKALFDFVSEARDSGERLFIFTSINSALHSAFSGSENVKFFILTTKTSSPQQINDKATLMPAHDLSVLLNASVEVSKIEKEKTINMLFDNLSDTIIRCGFEKTYSFMRFVLEAISSPKVTALFVFNPTAHDSMISSSIRGLFQNQMAYTKSGPKVGTL